MSLDRVRFLLSTNLPGSISRITADTASLFVHWGIPTTVAFPAIDWWDYRLFQIRRLSGLRRWKWALRLLQDAAFHLPFRKSWCGFRYYAADPKIEMVRFFATPTDLSWRPGEITVVHPPYLIPHLLRTIPDQNTCLVSAIHMNLEKAMNSPCPETAAWYRHWVAREQMLQLPRYTTSVEAKEAAQRLGIPIRRVIHEGSVNLELFHPDPSRRKREGLCITLYCDLGLQKGQAVGVEALRAVRSQAPQVRLCSIGRVFPRHRGLFDFNYGFLHGGEFVKALQESDLFVYPSLYDGFPAPPLQAMACGSALVTTAVEGVKEYAVHEQNALLVPPGDPHALQEQVIRLVQDQWLRELLQSKGPPTAQRFDVRQTARELLDFLEEVYEESHSFKREALAWSR